ncbi:Ferripyoverdine receptor precursor [Lacunisphaera limnophila]|uniref:Ferripyoverdine receptor n=1 Tax=Lacunisphaera limnophila TaxID=1838286 RepID=A0A1D8ATX0_9BACT|nr:TonB-dependent receptor [Lacunisphaera limnophila]AOS44306.1 Ferripyoverdine receptor precursor [Lacunisphaera limnophila]
MNTNLLRTLLSGLALASLTGPSFAQTTPPVDNSPPTDGEVLELERFKVTSGVDVEAIVLPIARPFNSVFGTDDNIVDVPRNVTIISRQQLSDISIESVLDFSKLTSSAFTTTNFGAPSNASIRGQSADVFLNGVRSRITSNGNGLPVDFNSVESVNIVKGPATAVQGASMYVGGFIDLVSKRPYFDKTKGSVSATIGSYNTKRWTVDVGGPISKELAYRASYSGEDSDGYYVNGFKKTHSFYGALSYRPNPNYELFVNSQFFVANYTENWGINRVTQNLIDHGLYTTGININNGSAGSPSDAQNSYHVQAGGNTIAWGPEVKINRHTRLLRPSNDSYGEEFNIQAIQTLKLSAEMKLKNTSFYSHTERDTISTYYYSEIIDPSYFMENRTEFIYDSPKFTVNTGLDLRYQRTKAYDDYFFEPANVWDITKDVNFINVYNSAAFVNGGRGFAVPGWPGRFAQPGLFNGDTNDSKGTTIGPFAQSTWNINDKWSLVTGVRVDYFKAKVREPLLPPFVRDEMSVSLPNYNVSLIYKPTTTSSVYATYNNSKNTSGAVGNGGGITGWDGNNFGQLDKELFQQPSELYEIGTKYALAGNTVFLNFAAYDQKRTAKSTSSTVVQEYHYKGFEAELNYQPNKHIYATMSYSYIDAEASVGFQYAMFDPGELPPGNSTNAAIMFGNTAKVSGLPSHLFNALASYSFDNGFSVSANAVLTGEMNNNTAGSLVIPFQYTIDASASYAWKDWNFRMQILNVTDEENWSPPNAVYGNGSILALPGTQVQFSVKYSF